MGSTRDRNVMHVPRGREGSADLTSALYLGLTHPAWSLAPWPQLTTGRPAVLGTPPLARRVSAALAELMGCERAALWSSTLHAFWDLFAHLADDAPAVLVDASAYPIARWASLRTVARGGVVHRFAHHDPEHLARLAATAGQRRRWVAVTDGYCPDCGCSAPLGAYTQLAEARGGLVVVDDTQALGVLGREPSARQPYGGGGGGSLAHAGGTAGPVMVVSSLAKGFGVPLAVTAGPRRLVERLERHGETRVHASPPSIAHVSAAHRALAINRSHGDRLRRRLAGLVRRFRAGLAGFAGRLLPTLFPVQMLALGRPAAVAELHRSLLRRGVVAVAVRRRCRRDTALAFLITARHAAGDIDRAVEGVAHLAALSA